MASNALFQSQSNFPFSAAYNHCITAISPAERVAISTPPLITPHITVLEGIPFINLAESGPLKNFSIHEKAANIAVLDASFLANHSKLAYSSPF